MVGNYPLFIIGVLGYFYISYHTYFSLGNWKLAAGYLLLAIFNLIFSLK